MFFTILQLDKEKSRSIKVSSIDVSLSPWCRCYQWFKFQDWTSLCDITIYNSNIWQGYYGIRHWMIKWSTCPIMYIMTLKSLSTANLNQRIKYYPRFASLKSYQTFIKSIIYSPLFSHSLYFWYPHPLSTKSGP